jgi:alcohol dehydrogenase class IV
MKSFTYFQPTQIVFGNGRINEVGELVASIGKRCLLVTVPASSAPSFQTLFDTIKENLKTADITVEHFSDVTPNPTTDVISNGAVLAKSFGAEVILGVGGGSSMDVAKAIAVEATHPGTAWDYRWCSEKQPTEKTLPVIAVPTTSGTGSEVSQVAVLTNPKEKDKSAIYNEIIFPKIAIVDPELTKTVPSKVTSQTGFDVFTHAFESLLHPNASPFIEILAQKAISLVIEHLPKVVKDGDNLESRENMALASVLAGLCIAHAGVTLPHGIGMTISGYCPQVPHGAALAVVYPEFTRFTYQFAPLEFARIGRLFDSSLENEPDDIAAEKFCAIFDEFMQEINMWIDLESFGVTKEEIKHIADHSQVLPDYKNNPRVASRDEIFEILVRSFSRK